METLFLYFGKVILISSVLFFYYLLFLKDKTFHQYNRFYLLAVIMISLLLPVLKISYFTLEVNTDNYLLINKLQHFSSTKNLNHEFFYFKIFAFIFGVVAVFFLTKLMTGLVKIELFKRKYKKENLEGINFYETDLAEAPFSFFKNLFWKNSIDLQSDLGRQILKHEIVHIEQKHSWDKIFLEITTALFWFNPFFYLIKKEIILIHEYLADKKALKNSDTKAFAQMLLASHFSGKLLPAASPFFNSNLKKRLTMLKKSKTKFSYARRILALPLLFTLVFMYLVNAKNKEILYTNQEVDKMVSALKSDTISPNTKEEQALQIVQNQIGEKQKEIQPLVERFNVGNEDARKLSEELRKKSEQLERFSSDKDFNNPKFKALNQEIDKLGLSIDAIYNEEGFKNAERLINEKYGEIDQLYAKLDRFYNSDEFKNKMEKAEFKMKEAEKKYNSPEYQKKMKAAELKMKEAEKKFNSPEYQKKMKEAELKMKEAEKKFNSPAFQKKIDEVEKRATETAKRITPPQLNIKFQEPAAEVVPSKEKENPTIFIDDKLSTNEEMQKLNPNTIESMHVYKKGFEGKKNGEIHIKLKK